jgi:hypothetical protein
MARERFYLFDATLRARSRTGAEGWGFASRIECRARTRKNCRRASPEDDANG